MTKKLQQTLIDSVNVNDHLRKWKVTHKHKNEVSSAELTFSKNIENTVNLKHGMIVEIWQGYSSPTERKIFKGRITKIERDKGLIKLKCNDMLMEAVYRNVTALYDYNTHITAGKISEIFKDVLENNTSLKASVVDSGTNFILKKFACFDTDVYDRLNALCAALNWQFYYRPETDDVRFEPKGNSVNVNPIEIRTGLNNVVGIPKWTENINRIVNRLKIKGASITTSKQETFSGNGSMASFTLLNKVESIQVYVSNTKNYAVDHPLPAEERIGGVRNQSTNFDYSLESVLDANNNEVTRVVFEDTAIPPTGTNNVLCSYTYITPVPVILEDEYSIANYTGGVPAEQVITLPDIESIEDAENRGKEILSEWAYPRKRTKLRVRGEFTQANKYAVGELVSVKDSFNNVNENFVIKEITFSYPEGIDELVLGDEDFELADLEAEIAKRLKRLEEEYDRNNRMFYFHKTNSASFNVIASVSSLKTQKLNDSFILSHPINSIIYDANQTVIHDDFETISNWLDDSIDLTETITADSIEGHFWIGGKGVNVAWSESSGTGAILNTVALSDWQNVVGVASGTPIQGTAGVWVYSSNYSVISGLKVRIGSNSSNYAEYNGFSWSNSSLVWNEDNERTLIQFDLTSPDNVVGSPDWTAINYVRFSWIVSGPGNMTFDYFTASKNNDLSLNGLGERFNEVVLV